MKAIDALLITLAVAVAILCGAYQARETAPVVEVEPVAVLIPVRWEMREAARVL